MPGKALKIRKQTKSVMISNLHNQKNFGYFQNCTRHRKCQNTNTTNQQVSSPEVFATRSKTQYCNSQMRNWGAFNQTSSGRTHQRTPYIVSCQCSKNLNFPVLKLQFSYFIFPIFKKKQTKTRPESQQINPARLSLLQNSLLLVLLNLGEAVSSIQGQPCQISPSLSQ